MTTMSWIIDILIVLIALIIIIRSAIRGFIKSFISFSKSILAVLIAYIFCSPLARFLSEKIFLKLSGQWVYNAFVSTSDGNGGYHIYSLFDGMPNWVVNFLGKTDIGQERINMYFTGNETASIELVEDFASKLGYTLSMFISKIVAFLIIFIVMEIVIAIIGSLFNKVKKVPVLGFINVILGILLGVVTATVMAWLITMAVYGIIWFGANYRPDMFSMDIINKSVIAKFLYEHNLWDIVKNIWNK